MAEQKEEQKIITEEEVAQVYHANPCSNKF